MQGTQWRFLPLAMETASRNMALDEFMLQYAAKKHRPILRFYRWQPAALSIGYFQKFGQEVNEDACQTAGIHWVRRPTGGRAVLHQHELTYAVAIPLGYPGLPQGITETYRWLSEALVHGLKAIGVPAEMAVPQTKEGRGQTAACFDSPSRYEITANGRKIVGSAQVRRDGVLLQHGSILERFDLNLLLEVMAWPSERARNVAARLLGQKAGSLDRFLTEIPDDRFLEETFLEAFSQRLGVEGVREPLQPEEVQQVDQWQRVRYEQDSWNRRI